MNNLNSLFPGYEAFDDDINVNIDTTGASEDEVAAAEETAAVSAETDASTEGELQTEEAETTAATTAFAHQFCELCAMQEHVATYGVDRTFLALCNRDNILGRALNINLPAMESFDTVGSPYSPVSIACVEALSDGLWHKFKEWCLKIWEKIKNFFIKIADWFREAFGNYDLRYNKYKKWADKVDWNSENSLKKKWKDKKIYCLKNDDATDFIKRFNDSKFIKDVIDSHYYKDAIATINSYCKAANTYLAGHYTTINSRDGANRTSAVGNYDAIMSGSNTGNARSYTNPSTPGRTPFGSEKDHEKLNKFLEKCDKAKKDLAKLTKEFKTQKMEDANSFKSVDENDRIKALDIIHSDVTVTLSELEVVIKRANEWNRIKQSADMGFKQTMERLNESIRRTEGSSVGAKSRAEISRAYSLAQRIVFKSGMIPTLNSTIIKICFGILSGYQNVVVNNNLTE